MSSAAALRRAVPRATPPHLGYLRPRNCAHKRAQRTTMMAPTHAEREERAPIRGRRQRRRRQQRQRPRPRWIRGKFFLHRFSCLILKQFLLRVRQEQQQSMNTPTEVSPLDRRLSMDFAQRINDEFASAKFQFLTSYLFRMSPLRVGESLYRGSLYRSPSFDLQRPNARISLECPLYAFGVLLNRQKPRLLFTIGACTSIAIVLVVSIPPPAPRPCSSPFALRCSFLTAFHHIYPRLHCESQGKPIITTVCCVR